MPNQQETINSSATLERGNSPEYIVTEKTFFDYFALAFSTFGVGYLPIAPGTWGSIVGVLIYLLFVSIEAKFAADLVGKFWTNAQLTAFVRVFNSIVFLLFCFLGIWASSRAAEIFQTKDPQKVVVDEVMGQIMVFLFVPFLFSWKFVLAGFILFRLFDIWKPYPINSLENLPAGIGVCADDILAGVYGGICLTFLYAINILL